MVVEDYDAGVEFIKAVFGAPFKCAVCGKMHAPSKTSWLRCYARALRRLYRMSLPWVLCTPYVPPHSYFPSCGLNSCLRDQFLEEEVRAVTSELLRSGRFSVDEEFLLAEVKGLFSRYRRAFPPCFTELELVTKLDECLEVAKRCGDLARAEIRVILDAASKLLAKAEARVEGVKLSASPYLRSEGKLPC